MTREEEKCNKGISKRAYFCLLFLCTRIDKCIQTPWNGGGYYDFSFDYFVSIDMYTLLWHQYGWSHRIHPKPSLENQSSPSWVQCNPNHHHGPATSNRTLKLWRHTNLQCSHRKDGNFVERIAKHELLDVVGWLYKWEQELRTHKLSSGRMTFFKKCSVGASPAPGKDFAILISTL